MHEAHRYIHMMRLNANAWKQQTIKQKSNQTMWNTSHVVYQLFFELTYSHTHTHSHARLTTKEEEQQKKQIKNRTKSRTKCLTVTQVWHPNVIALWTFELFRFYEWTFRSEPFEQHLKRWTEPRWTEPNRTEPKHWPSIMLRYTCIRVYKRPIKCYKNVQWSISSVRHQFSTLCRRLLFIIINEYIGVFNRGPKQARTFRTPIANSILLMILETNDCNHGELSVI